MTELSFAKSFLSTVDARPIKLRYDHVVDPASMRVPVPYTLPRLPPSHPPMRKKIKISAAPGSSKSTSVQLRSARNPVLEFSIDNAPLATTSVHDLREAVRERVVAAEGTQSPSADKIKILYKKKPVGGSAEKTLAEILADSEPDALHGGKTVEFGVMIMGGATVKSAPSATTESPAGTAATVAEADPLPSNPAQGLSGAEAVKTDAFWKDLEGYLELRMKDTPEALRLAGIFKRAWEAEGRS